MFYKCIKKEDILTKIAKISYINKKISLQSKDLQISRNVCDGRNVSFDLFTEQNVSFSLFTEQNVS